MKSKIQASLQKILGYKRYLFIFSLYKYFTMRYDSRLEDFFHFLDIIPSEKSVLDIGANLGYMSLLFSKKVKRNRVFSFEPVKDNYDVLVRNIQYFGRVNIIPFLYALGDIEKEVNISTPVIKGVRKQGLSKISEARHTSTDGVNYRVTQKTLDSFVELKDVQIGAIKIDVEGYEYFVLKGGMSILEKNKPIIFCELWEEQNFTNCNELLKSLGYNIFYYSQGELLPYQFDKPTKVINFFFIHKGDN